MRLDSIKVVNDWSRYYVSPNNIAFPAREGERWHGEMAERIIKENDELRQIYDRFIKSEAIPKRFKNTSSFMLLYGFVDVYAVDEDYMVYYCSKSTSGQKNDTEQAEQYNYLSQDIWTSDIDGYQDAEEALTWVLAEREKIRDKKTDMDYDER